LKEANYRKDKICSQRKKVIVKLNKKRLRLHEKIAEGKRARDKESQISQELDKKTLNLDIVSKIEEYDKSGIL
jgi:hypothetical protein